MHNYGNFAVPERNQRRMSIGNSETYGILGSFRTCGQSSVELTNSRMIPRAAENTLRQLAKGYPVLAITGPRQSGKTTLARAIFDTHPGWLRGCWESNMSAS